MRVDKEDGWLPRLLRGPGPRQTVVAVAAVLLAVSALGFLIWATTTRSPSRLAWLTSIATVLAVVLPSWGMSAAMLTWVARSRRPVTEAQSGKQLDPAMLAGEEAVQAFSGSGAGGGNDGGAGPVTLPADAEMFTGRGDLIGEVLEQLDPGREHADVTVVSAVDGMAGVGKTALAVHAARVAYERGWFPGGVLLENLRGFSAGKPVDYGSAAARLVRALGVPGAGMPDTPEGWRAAWHNRLARLGRQGRPMLVVLDNVASAGQVSPLLPDLPHRMLITSRHTLSALRGYRVPVPPFTPDEGVRFLDNALRAARPADHRVKAEPEEARRLAELCGYLPLALRIIVALLRDEPDRALAAQAAELADAATRLDRLRYDDVDEQGQPLAVRAAFDLSYEHLTAIPELARTFRLLAWIPGADVSTDAAAAAFGSPVADARRQLAELARRHWADKLPGERWGMHDLARLYAEKRAREHAQADGSESAIQRLYSYYTVVLSCADAWLGSSRTATPARPGPFGLRADAVAWLDGEYRALAAAIAAACGSRRWEEAYQLAIHLATYQEFRHLIDDGVTVATQGLTAARHLGRARECSAAMRLGNAYRVARRYEEAADYLKRALELAPAHDATCEGSIRHNLGLTYLRLGQFAEAEACHRRDLEICREAEDWRGAGEAMIALADALLEQGRVRDAIGMLNRAIVLFEGSGDPRNLALARGNLAHTCLKGFPFTRAAFVIWQLCAALKHERDLDDRGRQAHTFLNLANAYVNRCLGCHARAAAEWGERAAILYRDLADESGEADALRFVRLAEAAAEDPEAHTGCPGSGDKASERLRDWLNDLPHAVLRGADSRLDQATFAGNIVIGSTQDGSRLPDELLTHNPLRLFLPGEDLTVREAVTVLQEKEHPDDSDEDLEALAAGLGFHAAAVAMAAAYLRRAPSSAGTLLQRLSATSLDDPYHPHGPETAGAAKMATLAIESAEQQAPRAGRVLDLVALLAPGQVDTQVLARELPPDDATEIGAAVHALADAAVIAVSGNTVTISSLAAQAARDRAALRGTLLNAASTAARILDSQISALEGTPTRVDHLEGLSRQVGTVWAAVKPELAVKPGGDSGIRAGAADMMKLRTWQVNTLTSTGRAADAIELGSAVLSDCQRLLGESHQETWRARNNLAGAYSANRDYDHACALFAQNLLSRDTGADNPDRLLTLHNLGVMHAQADRPKRAAQILAGVLADRERVLGARDPGTLETRHWLGVVRARTGDLPEAIRLLEETAQGRRNLSKPSADLTGTLDVLAELYAKSRQTDKSLLAREESMAISERLFEPGDVRVITVRDELADQYLRTWRTKKAVALLKRNLAEAGKAHGPDAEITRLTRQRLQYAQRQAKKPGPQGE